MKAVGFFDSAGTGPRAGRLRLATVTFVSVAIAIRCSIGFHPYSGMGTPPIFGDFEAQRHWMEITTALPAADWYRNTPENDLLYWGLDYPPLTAYHSYLCGRVLGWLEPGSMELHTSRGYETPTHKTHMRATVLFAELLTFFPAVFLFVSRFYRAMAERQKTCITLTVLLLPPLVLIDHGHFQYNAVSLGFHTLGLALLAGPGDRSEMRRYSGIVDAAATVAICLAVNYKQMCLVSTHACTMQSANSARGFTSAAARWCFAVSSLAAFHLSARHQPAQRAAIPWYRCAVCRDHCHLRCLLAPISSGAAAARGDWTRPEQAVPIWSGAV